jgi:hypothetical protein
VRPHALHRHVLYSNDRRQRATTLPCIIQPRATPDGPQHERSEAGASGANAWLVCVQHEGPVCVLDLRSHHLALCACPLTPAL